VRATVAPSIHEADAASWDAIAGEDDPFAEHAFLAALEDSGSICEATGWKPQHLLVHEGDALVGAMPLYEKTHSYGEYIFDFAWANASHRAGARYYPKLVSMTPATPATGTRLLIAKTADRAAVTKALLDAAIALAEKSSASSIHLLFLSALERDDVARDGRFAARLSEQFHFTNDGYTSFEDLLSRFRSPSRKQIKRERRIVAESGLEIRTLTGDELSPEEWRALRRFYVDTCGRKGSPPYLKPDFFDRLARTFASRVVAVLAYEGGAPVAGTLNFEKGKHLYGRYWGADSHAEMLHFELCYYRLIERTIARGLSRFEAGAQGEHKLKRGLMPSEIHSAHLLRDPRLDAAIRDFLPREAEAVREEIATLAAMGPFKRDGIENDP
jgi:predicted N-acyltransferase